MRGAAKKSGRIDLAGAGHGSMAKAAVKAHNEGISQADTDKLLVEAARSTANSDIVRGKPVSTAQLAGALGRNLNGTVQIARSGLHADGTIAAPETIVNAKVEAGQVAAKLANIQSNLRFGHEMGADALYNGKGDADSPQGIGIAGKVEENIKFIQSQGDDSAYKQAYKQEYQSSGFDGVNDPRMPE